MSQYLPILRSRISSILLNLVLNSVLTLALALTGCRTTEKNLGSVIDQSRGSITFYSSQDTRTYLSSETVQSDIRSIAEALKLHLKTNRDDLNTMSSLARIQVALGDYDAAEKNCRRVLRGDVKNLDVRKTLAEIALRRRQYDLAAIYLGSIGGTHSQDSGVLNMLALVELQQGHQSVSMNLFKKAIRLNPSDIAPRMNLGVLFVRYRMFTEAAVEFERVLKVAPAQADATVYLAIVKSSRGDLVGAEQLLSEVIKGDYDNPLARYHMAVVLKGLNRLPEAMSQLKIFLASPRARGKNDPQALALLETLQESLMAEHGREGDAGNEADAASRESSRSKVATQRDPSKDSKASVPTTETSEDRPSSPPKSQEADSQLDMIRN